MQVQSLTLDINADGEVQALDALLIINHLNAAARADNGEGEPNPTALDQTAEWHAAIDYFFASEDPETRKRQAHRGN